MNDVLLRTFALPCDLLREDWPSLACRLMKSLEETASRKIMRTKQGHTIEYDEMSAVGAKPIIDNIDMVLAKYFGFTAEEIDYIINYDIKYRMGQESEGGDEE